MDDFPSLEFRKNLEDDKSGQAKDIKGKNDRIHKQ